MPLATRTGITANALSIRTVVMNKQAYADDVSDVTADARRSVIEVTEAAHGARRHVRILTPQKGTYSDRREFDTDWPQELLCSLAALKGEWFLDSYQRFEHPNYIQKQIDVVLDLYNIRLGDDLILDFGCGFGASSYCMIKRGARRILASDLERGNTDFASQFFRSMGMVEHVDIRCGDIVQELQPASLSVIWLQAVMEHLLPEERRSYLRRFWETLTPGGLLIITETPNRVWPVEGHTTGGTWWLPWMKPNNVFEKMRKLPKYREYSDVDFYRSGIIGSSYREILDCLGRPEDCEEASLGVRGYLKSLYSRAVRKSLPRRVAVGALGLAEHAARTALRRPITSYMPFLNHLVFKKGN
jgi:2-polyprenyl-3-methyl-5-hydroxy-6-metoxy-1,4-benzoquinol methylase